MRNAGDKEAQPDKGENFSRAKTHTLQCKMNQPKRICLICVEIFAWGKYGGFGKAARIIGRELVKRGYEVFAVVPRREDQKEEEILDGITVLGFLPRDVLSSTTCECAPAGSVLGWIEQHTIFSY